MNTYKIYKLNQSVKDLLEQYPEIKEKLLHCNQRMFILLNN